MSAIAPSIPTQSDAVPAQATLSDRFISVQVQSFNLVIPAAWVAEIFRIEKSQILPLPFYNPLLVGITHHGGRVLPLLSAHHLLKAASTSLRENTMVVKLNDAAGTLAHVGLVVDRTLGSQTRTELPATLFSDSLTAESLNSASEPMLLLRSEWVSPDLWQPQHWLPDNSA
jgi:chemotaxis signal transduction protein